MKFTIKRRYVDNNSQIVKVHYPSMNQYRAITSAYFQVHSNFISLRLPRLENWNYYQ